MWEESSSVQWQCDPKYAKCRPFGWCRYAMKPLASVSVHIWNFYTELLFTAQWLSKILGSRGLSHSAPAILEHLAGNVEIWMQDWVLPINCSPFLWGPQPWRKKPAWLPASFKDIPSSFLRFSVFVFSFTYRATKGIFCPTAQLNLEHTWLFYTELSV